MEAFQNLPTNFEEKEGRRRKERREEEEGKKSPLSSQFWLRH
jgi:hypothetical protein